MMNRWSRKTNTLKKKKEQKSHFTLFLILKLKAENEKNVNQIGIKNVNLQAYLKRSEDIKKTMPSH